MLTDPGPLTFYEVMQLKGQLEAPEASHFIWAFTQWRGRFDKPRVHVPMYRLGGRGEINIDAITSI